jgi:hypothetical protein
MRTLPFLAALALAGLLAGPLCRTQPGHPIKERVAGKELAIHQGPDDVVVRQGERTLLRYRFRSPNSHKPYVQELTSPAGVNVLRDAPADHLHHHGLMFACRANGVNFWEETAGTGFQVHRGWEPPRVVTVPGGKGGEPSEAAVLREHLDWQDKDAKLILKEDRELRIQADRAGQPRLLTWQTALTVPPRGAAVALTGTNYNGLGARFLKAMDVGGSFRNSRGAAGVAATKGKRTAWCAYTAAPAAGRPVTVALFDAPSNLRHPARWYTMDSPFAYLSATLGLDTEPLRLDPGRRLVLTYGVAVFEGRADHEAIEAAYRRWQQARP